MTAAIPVQVTVADGIARVTIDNPPVNALSQAVRAGLMTAVERIDGDSSVCAAVLHCAGRTFVSGADIKELGKPPLAPFLPDAIAAIEDSSIPWVAAIHGTALGGGLELALGCHGRVAEPSSKLGFPEVTLGIIPGAGGTARLPRLVPVATAIEMITGGKPVGAASALASGLVDTLSEGDLLGSAERLVRRLVGAGRPVALSRRDPVAAPDADGWAAVEAEIRRKARGQTSPLEALKALKEAVSMSAAEAFPLERARFLRLSASTEAAALRHMFFAERNTAASLKVLKASPVDLTHVGVIGGGTMGAGIATALLIAESRVTLIERDADAATAAEGRVAETIRSSAKRGVLSEAAASAALGRLATGSDYVALADCQLVIEAVFEDLSVKADVFSRLDAGMPEAAILATNTSYLNVNAIATATRHPERVLGLHFFSPAHVMKLLEIVRADVTSDQALATGLALAKRLKKVPVVARVCDGFIGNRIMAAYRRECDFMLEEGALPCEIDVSMKDFGYAMGIFEMQDLAGLDIAWAMRKRRAATRPASERYSRIADRLCEAGRLGRKTGAGWYRYEDSKAMPDPAVTAIIIEESARHGLTRQTFTADEIMARILSTMQAEAQAILAEGIAENASDIDVVMVTGYGFPRHRGGPMFMAG